MTSTTPEGFDPEDTQSIRIPVMPLADKLRTDNPGLVDQMTQHGTRVDFSELTWEDNPLINRPTGLLYLHSDGRTYQQLTESDYATDDVRELMILEVALRTELNKVRDALSARAVRP